MACMSFVFVTGGSQAMVNAGKNTIKFADWMKIGVEPRLQSWSTTYAPVYHRRILTCQFAGADGDYASYAMSISMLIQSTLTYQRLCEIVCTISQNNRVHFQPRPKTSYTFG